MKDRTSKKDASGDREDGKEDDDDMPCVIGKSEGDCVQTYVQTSVLRVQLRQYTSSLPGQFTVIRNAHDTLA